MITGIGDIKNDIPMFAVCYTIAFVAYILLAFRVAKDGESSDKTAFWIIIAFSVIFRFTLMPAAPSDDIYRYIWEGKLQLNGINPYLLPPNSETLAHFRDDLYAGINHKDLTTIYPPLSLLMFALGDVVSHSLIAMKSVFLFFEFLLIFIIIRLLKLQGKNACKVLIYAWSPLPLISFAARGHCDSLQIFFVVLALYLYAKRGVLAPVVAISLAVVSKFISVIVLPFFLIGKKPKYIFVVFAVIGACYLPFVGAGKGLFTTLFHFGSKFHYNDSAHFVIHSLLPDYPLIEKLITSGIFGGVLIYLYKRYFGKGNFLIWWRPDNNQLSASPEQIIINNDNIIRLSFFAIGTFLILTPTAHPWYFTWIVPFLCFNHSKAWLILTGTLICYYFMNHSLFSSLIEYEGEWVWKEVHWLKIPEYAPFYLLLIYEFFQNMRKQAKTEH